MSTLSVAGFRNLIGRTSASDRQRLLLLATLVLLFAAGAGLRLLQMDSVFSGALADREYHSALIARGLYLEAAAPASDPRVQVAIINKEREGILEPPVLEYMSYAGYRIAGQENLAIPRLLSALYWLIGGLLLYRIARRVTSATAAVFAVAYYLFLPEGLRVSTGFQPDSLMVMLMLASIAAMIHYYDAPSTGRLLLAAALSGLTLLIRPLPVFVLLSGYVALGIWKWRSLSWIVSWRSVLYVGIALLPAAVFYLYYGVFVAQFMGWKSETSFRPSLLLHFQFWRDWFLVAIDTLEFPAVVAALIGIPFISKGLPRALMAGAAVGFVLFGLVFTFHIHTHNYYHAQLFPFVGIALGALAGVVLGHLKQACNRWYWWAPAVAALLVIAATSVPGLRQATAQFRGERPEIAREVGEIVQHSTSVLILGPYYGVTLKYFGELSGTFWPRSVATSNPMYRLPGDRELSIQERLNSLSFSPEYFVITDLMQWENYHADMRRYLDENWELVARSNAYIIYKAPDALPPLRIPTNPSNESG